MGGYTGNVQQTEHGEGLEGGIAFQGIHGGDKARVADVWACVMVRRNKWRQRGGGGREETNISMSGTTGTCSSRAADPATGTTRRGFRLLFEEGAWGGCHCWVDARQGDSPLKSMDVTVDDDSSDSVKGDASISFEESPARVRGRELVWHASFASPNQQTSHHDAFEARREPQRLREPRNLLVGEFVNCVVRPGNTKRRTHPCMQ